VVPSSGCKNCTSDETCVSGECKKNAKVKCTDNSECASNACGVVQGDPQPQCCADHNYINNSEYICSLDKGQPCSDNNTPNNTWCTSNNCGYSCGQNICMDPCPLKNKQTCSINSDCTSNNCGNSCGQNICMDPCPGQTS
jgi:hypothetical protein